METFLIKALQLILSLSILVIVHEFGLQAGRTAFDDYGSGRGVQLLAGFVYLFHDLVYVGRYVLAFEEHEDGYEL